MKKEEFRCPVCDTVGKWQNVDRFRLKPSEMHICETCGFVAYPTKYKTEEEIKEYYRKDYRSTPQASNLYTGERKLQYHNYFLKPILAAWKEAGITAPVVGEIGAAMGMFLNWIKTQVPEAEVHGTELTRGFRAVAFHEYGIRLEEDFDTSKKYDLIASYHVLEHQTEPDKKLKQYADCLKDSGVFYLSVPVWFRDLHNSALSGYDIEYYWATDHINSWSVQHLEHIIAKAGLEVVFKNEDVYGQTYILKKSTKTVMVPKWDFKTHFEFLDKAYKVWLHLQKNETAEALAIHKNCPVAWIHHYEFNRSKLDKDRPALEALLKEAIESCPNSSDALTFAGDISARYERYVEALDYFHKALAKRPNATNLIMGIANCYRSMALKSQDPQQKARLIRQSLDALNFIRNVSSEARERAISWMFHDMVQLGL